MVGKKTFFTSKNVMFVAGSFVLAFIVRKSFELPSYLTFPRIIVFTSSSFPFLIGSLLVSGEDSLEMRLFSNTCNHYLRSMNWLVLKTFLHVSIGIQQGSDKSMNGLVVSILRRYNKIECGHAIVSCSYVLVYLVALLRHGDWIWWKPVAGHPM